MTDLSPFAAALADAIARRHDLAALARSGWGIPAAIAHEVEANVRTAEHTLLAAAQSLKEGTKTNGPQDHPKG